LVSEFSPEINYELITSAETSLEESSELNGLLEKVNCEEDYKEKRKIIFSIEKYLEKIMSQY
jgi:hypothetical protein